MASPSHSRNITASPAAAFMPCNHSRGSLTGSCLIAGDLGLEYLIDSPHIPSRILASSSSVTAGTANPNNPAGCGRTTTGKPYGPCTPEQNPRPPNCGIYNRAC
ncbi:hypothetical protein NL676_033069 [Syzygium grande]|nr:hypothetical protein NL676_033069 [Syzygium grande]